ncbi:kielin/chordin-like protein [Asterias rubens]|uniref:kielin/chordin-like protein n=1 Tax=Asterias rubens TaxID=7604 RepID=UPI0014559510|nr:kielin/chordin-like protein [Asterias rubens]
MAAERALVFGLAVCVLLSSLVPAWSQSIGENRFKIDMLQVFKDGETSMKGVSEEVGSHPGMTSFRVRPSVPTLTLERESVQELRRHLNNTLTLVITAKQVYNSAGTIFTVTTGDNSPLLMLSTNLRTGVMRLKYRAIGVRSFNEVLTTSPFAETDLQEWANVGIILSGRRMRIYEGCDTVRDITLQDGAIDLNIPEDALVYVVQGVKGKNKFSGWVQDFWLYPSELTEMPWTCSTSEEAPNIVHSIAPSDKPSDVTAPSTTHTNTSSEPLKVTPSFNRTSVTPRKVVTAAQGDEAPMESPVVTDNKEVLSDPARAALEELKRETLTDIRAAQTAPEAVISEQDRGLSILALQEQRIIELETMVQQFDDMMGMLKTQVSSMERRLVQREACECLVKACMFNGGEYGEGQAWQPDPCTVCYCQQGQPVCSFQSDRPECFNPCLSNPCHNSGTCESVPGYSNYSCICPPGCGGDQCQHMKNVCTLPQENNGCESRGVMYYFDMFTQRCEINYSGCLDDGNSFNTLQQCEERCMIGACCYRTYMRGSSGQEYLDFTDLRPGFTCEVQPLRECRQLNVFYPTGNQRHEVTGFHPGRSCEEVSCDLPDGCIYMDSTYAVGETFRTHCQECRCMPEGRLNCRCTDMTIRKELRDMTRDELDRFQAAVQQLRMSAKGNSWEHARDVYMKHIMEANSIPAYLMWHRLFLRQMERQLQEIDCSIALPYYDFTTDVADFSKAVLWQPNYFGGDGLGSCVEDHPFRGGSLWTPCLIRKFSKSMKLPSKIDVAMAMSATDFDTFSMCMQTIMGHVFNYVGGHVASSGAPYDPVFYALQAYVDMIFWRWQQKVGNYGSFPAAMLDVPMVPFNAKARDILNSESHLCVTYSLISAGNPCNGSSQVFGRDGYDQEGFDRNGFNQQGYDRAGYSVGGYNIYGEQDTRDLFLYGEGGRYDYEGYDRSGYDQLGFNRYGYKQDGFNRDGFNIFGFNIYGYDRYGYNENGFSSHGYDRNGYSENGYQDTTGRYNANGYDQYCLDRYGLSQDGYDTFGFNLNGVDIFNCDYLYNGPFSMGISARLDRLLYRQSKQFLMDVIHTCPRPSQLPLIWFEQTWSLQQKPLSRGRTQPSTFPSSVTANRFCFDVETFLDSCICESSEAFCPINPCNSLCNTHPEAVCFYDLCGSCTATWYDNGQEVNCGQSLEDDCLNGTTTHVDGSTWKPDPCTTCMCRSGSVNCFLDQCTPLRCRYPAFKSGYCCPKCDDCMIGNTLIPNGNPILGETDACLSCICQNGDRECQPVQCPFLSCENPVKPIGECCPTCSGIGCEFNGYQLDHSQTFEQDACTTCTCLQGRVECSTTTCPVLTCPSQTTPDGECCPQCTGQGGCVYEDMSFNSGDFFTPMANPCLRCSCLDSKVRCNPIACSRPPCDNPVLLLGACCPECTDKCVVNGKQYNNDQRWISEDQCQHCTCHEREVDCVDLRPCVGTCQHGFIPIGQCCPVCTDCLYDERRQPNGEIFISQDECSRCLCSFGTVTCEKLPCEPLPCQLSEVLPGECCPVCRGCVDDFGDSHEHMSHWTPVFSVCQDCYCEEGQIACEVIQCQSQCSHAIIKPENCCPICDGCLYEGQEYQNGDPLLTSDPCRECTCEMGSVSCSYTRCDQVGCSRPYTPPGQCCAVCQECEFEGQYYENGREFYSSVDPCQLCNCQQGELVCRNVQNSCSPQCTHPSNVPDQCCPVCSNCVFESREIPNGRRFRHPDDHCQVCTCTDGFVVCEPEPCNPVSCRNPVLPPGECCYQCETCIAVDGREYTDGQQWTSSQDKCYTCTCKDRQVGCELSECPVLDCSNPGRPQDACCAECENCEFDRRYFSNYQEFINPLNRCEHCQCLNGNIVCEALDCPPLPCPNPVTLSGECCPQCLECEYLGNVFRDGEAFKDPGNPCIDCLCQQGQVQCDYTFCPPVSCEYPITRDCCDVCDGCLYRSQEFQNGEPFSDPNNPCIECNCLSGNVHCNMRECPPLPDNCEQFYTPEGECCPICTAIKEKSCVYGDVEYQSGDTFLNPINACEECRCKDKKVTCKGRECPGQGNCQHPYDGECCPVCDDCTYQTLHYSNGAVFANPDDECSQCRCQNGNVDCGPLPCSSVFCVKKYIPEGGCCEVCPEADCELDGRTYLHGQTFLNPRDSCQNCECDNGNLRCEPSPCDPIECTHPIREQCCQTCNGCLYNGLEYQSRDVFDDPEVSCQQCQCLLGNVECIEEPCQQPICKFPVKPSGECCPICDDCFYTGRFYRNRETFMDPEDQCQECTCRDGDVTCEPVQCRDVSCPNPRQNECGCPACDGCIVDGAEYMDGSQFPDVNNSCRGCTCRQGHVECQLHECPPARCLNPITRSDYCCPVCDGCSYDSNSYDNGQSFQDTVDTCRICTCLNGNVNCAPAPCTPVSCTHGMPDQCLCPACDGCMYEDVMVQNGESFMDPTNMCRDCYCLAGSVVCTVRTCPPIQCTNPVRHPGECCDSCPQAECLRPDDLDPCQDCECVNGEWDCRDLPCPLVTCPHAGQGQCCLECIGCTFGGKPWGNGDDFPDPVDSCRNCHCREGFVLCEDPICPPVQCTNAIIPAGKCCPVCTGQCTVDGVKYDNGQTYIPLNDPCQRCTCRNTQVFCAAIECSRVCAHPLQRAGQCCPVCDGCEFEGAEYQNNALFVHPNHVCQSCSCQNGNVECSEINCPRTTCPAPITPPGQCCGQCQECEYDARIYVDGDTWFSTTNRCEQCECKGTRVECSHVPCPNSDCTHPVQGSCCPICDGCLLEESIYNNGQSFRPDNCRECNCFNGNVLCVSKECPKLNCEIRVTDPGQCCERCQGCLYEGFEYASSESWVSPLNPCLSCQCQEGITLCTEIRCLTPDFCSNPVHSPDQCCPSCPGCTYNGINYVDGQRFRPYNDPCALCYCERGNLACLREVCPSLIDCPASMVLPAQPGDCCPTCVGALTSTCTADNVGAIMRPYGDPCLTCECKNISQWECVSDMCPMLMCPPSEQEATAGQCCPRCQRCHLETGEVFFDGQTWNQDNNMCITCTCDGGAVDCELKQCESIVCQQGQELYKPPDQCCFSCRDTRLPCYYSGRQHQDGEEWRRDDCTTCVCLSGQVQCQTSRCPPLTCQADEVPALEPGHCCPKCLSRPATCIAFGDPHYRTFDGRLIHFQGTCKYIMTMDCKHQDFIVEVKNDDRNAPGRVSWTQEVTIIIQGEQVDLGQNGMVKVNGIVVLLPYLQEPYLFVEQRGSTYYVNTNVGLQVLWDGSSYVEVSVPGSYARETCGMCGNFNTYPQDDLKMRNGQMASSDASFGNSWKVEGFNGDGCEAKDIQPCAEASYLARKLANAKCAVLKTQRFSPCHALVSPEPYFASCVYDMCACGASDACLCDALAAYAAECRQAGLTLSWRSDALCAINCPENRGFMFDECGPACPRTCANKDIPIGVLEEHCLRPCVPGCNCPANMVLYDGGCIQSQDCPLDYTVNATIVDSNGKH